MTFHRKEFFILKKLRMKASAFMSLLTVICLVVGTFAVFTDRFQSQKDITAGTLDITLTESWQDDNKALNGTFKPGTALAINYSLVNEGNMAAYVREQFVITSDKPFSNAPEFDLYKKADATVENSVVKAVTVANALKGETDSYTKDGKTYYTLTYSVKDNCLSEFILNGTAANGQEDPAGVDSYSGAYYLVFNTTANNDFQNAQIGIEYLAQALQVNGTGEATWSDAKVITSSVTIGGKSVSAVPVLN